MKSNDTYNIKTFTINIMNGKIFKLSRSVKVK